MFEADHFAARILKEGKSGYAGFAAARLLQDAPEFHQRYGAKALAGWKDNLAHRLEEISVALDTGHSEFLLADIKWERLSFQARQFPETDLAKSLESLASVLGESLPEKAQASVLGLLDQARKSFETSVLPTNSYLDPAKPLHRHAMKFMQTVLDGDVRKAVSDLQELMTGDTGPIDLAQGVIVPAQKEIGRMWHNAEATICEEHLVTEACLQALIAISHSCKAKPANGKTVMLASVAGNQHDLGIRLLGLDFQIEGWRAINLGTDMPAREIEAAALKYQPELVILSAALSVQLPALEQAVQGIKDALAEKAFILIGGQALSGLDREAHLFGANATGTSLEQARDIGQRLLAGVNPG
ncbi:MAG: cobalamin-dependent protein [Chromatiales bacterium]|nr:cobalamin-dependent protein [Chromatiales bacterium]